MSCYLDRPDRSSVELSLEVRYIGDAAVRPPSFINGCQTRISVSDGLRTGTNTERMRNGDLKRGTVYVPLDECQNAAPTIAFPDGSVFVLPNLGW